MNKQEFEKLSGTSVSDAEFETANAIYMAAEGIDKATFCKQYKHSKELCEAIYRTFEHVCKKAVESKNTLKNLCEEVIDGYCGNPDEGREAFYTAFRSAGQWLGTTGVINYKIQMDYQLTEPEKTYIKNHLQ